MKKKAIIAAAICALLLVIFIVADYLSGRNATTNFIAMNTSVNIDITGFNSKKAAEKIKSETIRLDSSLLSRTNSGSEIYAVNSGKAEVSDELAVILTKLKQIEKDSDGAFCIGLGTLSDLWGIGTDNAKVPSQEEIDAALKNADKWSIEGNTIYLPEGVKLDMGAVGKGIACDYADEILMDFISNDIIDLRESIIAVGGSVKLDKFGSGPNAAFKVGIRDPLGETNDYCAILNIAPDCVSTSGNYERFFEDENSKRYHHIFDPSTGYPADSGLLSVTVITNHGYVSDALSTACFVLGIEKSLPLLKKYSAQAVFITADKEIITTYGKSENQFITLTSDEYRLGELK